MKVAVLLATYNGEEYLGEQLESILDQSHSDLIILVRDDGSSDTTRTIIAGYQSRHPERVLQVPARIERAGPRTGFAELMEYALANKSALALDSAYLMFADQDDFWHPYKVARQVEVMQQLEERYPDRPLLVHSDLEIVNARRQTIASSFIAYQGLDPDRNSLGQVLISNIVTGCTAFINEPLARASLPVSERAIMHDWWVGVTAAAFGQLAFIDEQLVEYRQHGKNTVGAREFKPASLSGDEILRRLQRRSHKQLFVQVSTQARAFLDQHGAALSLRQRLVIRLAMLLRVRNDLLQSLMFRSLRRLRL